MDLETARAYKNATLAYLQAREEFEAAERRLNAADLKVRAIGEEIGQRIERLAKEGMECSTATRPA